MMPFKSKRLGPLLLIGVAFLIIFMVSAHVFGAVLLSNAVIGAFSLHSPILYVLIGLVIADRLSEGDMVRVIAVYGVRRRRDFCTGDPRAGATRTPNPANRRAAR